MLFHFITKKGLQAIVCGLLATSSSTCFADDTPVAVDAPKEEKKKPTRDELFSTESMKKLSLMYGHLIYKSMNNPMVKMDPNAVIQGIKEGQEGKSAPMTDKEYEETIGLIQQYAFEDMSKANLQEADKFLEKNKKEDGVVVLEEGKIQYKIMQPGTGDAVTEDTVPTINYTATYSNGQKLGSSDQQGGPIAVPLDDTIPGFRKGVMGMKVGEKRRIFVHPELGYGASGPLPNGLLIFEIEVTSVAPKPQAKDDNDNDEINDNDDDDNDDDDDDDFLSDNDDDDNDHDDDDDFADADDDDDDDDNN